MASIYRLLPRSYVAFVRTLNKLHRLIESSKPVDIHLSPSVLASEKENYPLFKLAYTEYAKALALQTKASAAAKIAQTNCKQLNSLFIQVFNFGVRAGIYKATSRRYFQLSIDNPSLPIMRKKEDIIVWANNLVSGEKLRVEAGGTAMINPAIEDISNALDIFVKATDTQTMAKMEFLVRQRTLSGLLPVLKELVCDVWDELNFYYRKLAPATKRNEMRGYGVSYSIDSKTNTEIDNQIIEVELAASENTCVEDFTADFKKGDSFIIHNTGNTCLEFYSTYLPYDKVPGSTIKIPAHTNKNIAVSELGSVHNLYFKVYNANKDLRGKCEIELNRSVLDKSFVLQVA